MIRVIDKHHLQVDEMGWWGEYFCESLPDNEAINAKLGYRMEYERRQFVVRFESGWRVSIIWGSMSYSDNHDHGFGHPPYKPFVEQPTEVEAAVFKKDSDDLQPAGEPFSYLPAAWLNTLLDHVSRLGTDQEYVDDPIVPSRRFDPPGSHEGDRL